MHVKNYKIYIKNYKIYDKIEKVIKSKQNYSLCGTLY